ncbi:MAG TPA: SIS domain-containing protein [Anaerolineae bacterium]|nr:SIS domain-containing protein [Anaerolineae bacterium]
MSAANDIIYDYTASLRNVLGRLPALDIAHTMDEILRAGEHGNMIFILGNGGSAATASHFACDLAKGTQRPGVRPFRVVALTDNVPLLTAWGNDTAYDRVFAEQLRPLVQPDDLVIGISGSGNSPNVLEAMRVAREAGARTVGWTGFKGGKLKSLVDVCVIAPSDWMEQIEDVHLILEHAVCTALRKVRLPLPVYSDPFVIVQGA